MELPADARPVRRLAQRPAPESGFDQVSGRWAAALSDSAPEILLVLGVGVPLPGAGARDGQLEWCLDRGGEHVLASPGRENRPPTRAHEAPLLAAGPCADTCPLESCGCTEAEAAEVRAYAAACRGEARMPDLAGETEGLCRVLEALQCRIWPPDGGAPRRDAVGEDRAAKRALEQEQLELQEARAAIRARPPPRGTACQPSHARGPTQAWPPQLATEARSGYVPPVAPPAEGSAHPTPNGASAPPAGTVAQPPSSAGTDVQDLAARDAQADAYMAALAGSGLPLCLHPTACARAPRFFRTCPNGPCRRRARVE